MIAFDALIHTLSRTQHGREAQFPHGLEKGDRRKPLVQERRMGGQGTGEAAGHDDDIEFRHTSASFKSPVQMAPARRRTSRSISREPGLGAQAIGQSTSPRQYRPATQHHRTPVPLQRWHFTTLSPFLSKPLPSQFLHFCFFLMFGPFSLVMKFSCRQRAVLCGRSADS
jgi:hypothetical protein